MNLVFTMMASMLGARVRTAHGARAHDGSDSTVPAGSIGTIRAVTSAGSVIEVEWDIGPRFSVERQLVEFIRV